MALGGADLIFIARLLQFFMRYFFYCRRVLSIYSINKIWYFPVREKLVEIESAFTQ